MKTDSLPKNPGCYIFRDRSRRIIYIGKAKDIRKRVSSYFQKKEHDAKTEALISHIDSVDFIVTDNEVEALILENNLIKKNQPKYNILLKDAKRYAYIELTDEDFPRLLLARKRTAGGKYFGPFTSAAERDHVLRIAQRLFQIRTCRRMPKRPCLRYHINLCTAPCAGHATLEEYARQIRKAGKFLSGRAEELIKELESDMRAASAGQRYEKALLFRDQINALKHLTEQQNVERQKTYDEDIINYMVRGGKAYVNLFNIYKGTLINRQEFIFEHDEGFLEEFMTRYYSENRVPKEIIVPKKTGDAIKGYLETIRKSKVRVIVPQKGEKKQLLELVKKNIEITYFGQTEKLEALRTKLRLQDTPFVIECFDISHTGGTSTVGSMVQFRNAKPDKSNYRRFRIRTVEGIDDFTAIAEVVRRRYARLKTENADMPDLVIIDGGKGQLSSAMNELEKLRVKVPMISIAKKLEEIYFPGSKFPLRLDRKEKALRFVQEIRDEAHRFAISYHKLLRKKQVRE